MLGYTHDEAFEIRMTEAKLLGKVIGDTTLPCGCVYAYVTTKEGKTTAALLRPGNECPEGGHREWKKTVHLWGY